MPIQYSNPFTAAATGLREALLRQEEQRRREEADQLARDREERLKAHDAANLERLKAEAASIDEQRKSQIDQRNTQVAETVAKTLVPGVIDASTADALRRGHLGGLVQGDTTLPAQSLALPAAGLDATPEQEAAAPVIAGQEHEAQAQGAQSYLGSAAQQEEAGHRKVFQGILDDPNASPEAKLAATFALGGRAVPSELLKGDETQTVFRASADRRKIERFENGQWVPHTGAIPENAHWLQEPTSSGANVNVNLGSDAVDLAAWQYLQTGTMPPLGMGAGGMRSAILERAAQLAKQGNINPQANAASYKADQQALNQVNRTISAVTAFENTAQRNIKIMQDAMKKVTDTGIPVLNRPLRDLQNMTGNKDVAAFNAAVRVVIPEIARILAQPNLTGQLTDTARHEIESVIRLDSTVEQMNAVMDLLIRDMAGRKTDLAIQKKAIEDAIRSRGPSGTPAVVAEETPEARGARLLGELTSPR